MLFNKSDLDEEIKRLNAEIIEKRKELAVNIQDNLPIATLRTLYAEIREKETRMEFCMMESEMQKSE